MTPTSKFNNSVEPVAELQETIAYYSQINVQNITQGSKMEETCKAKGVGGVPSLCALVSVAPSFQLLYSPTHKHSEPSFYVFLPRDH